MILRYRIDQNPGILALHSSYRGLGGIKRGCARHSCWMLPYRIVPYQAPSTPDIHSHHPRSTSYHTSTEPTRRAGLSLSVSLPPLAHLLLPVFPLFLFLFFFLFFSFLSFLSSPSYHRGFSQLCLDIDRLFPFFWPPQPVFGVLSHGRRQTVRRLWPPESLLRFLAILLYLLLSTLLRLDSIESSSSWCS